MAFPSLVGGTLVREDLVPSIVFAILFGCLAPLAVFRLLRKSSRTTLLIGTVGFSLERVVIFTLRAIQSRNQANAESHSLATYEQLTIGIGFITICPGLINFLRVLLVNATRPDQQGGTLESNLDRPRERFWYRRLSDFLILSIISAIIIGIISNSQYSQGIDHADVATRVMDLRYASTSIALSLTTVIGAIAFAASHKVKGVEARPASILMALCLLLSVVAIYRLTVMHNTTDSLLSRRPGSLSSPSAKALFYIFHVLPEWLASAALLGLNVRKVFRTGPFGDWRATDKETSRELENTEQKAERDRVKNQKKWC